MFRRFVCVALIFFRILMRRRFFYTHANLVDGIKRQKEKGGRKCKICSDCYLTMYLASAIKMKDPYKILEVYKLLFRVDMHYTLTEEFRGYFMEASAWLNDDVYEALKIANFHEVHAAEVIHFWRDGSNLDYDNIKYLTSRLKWPIEIIKGSICEGVGNFDAALVSYRNALKVMPNWLPEAKSVYDKINYLTNREKNDESRG